MGEVRKRILDLLQQRALVPAPLYVLLSILVHEKASILSLTQTGDIDAVLTMDNVVKDEFKRLAKREGYVYAKIAISFGSQTTRALSLCWI
jgi:hypothetical protein